IGQDKNSVGMRAVTKLLQFNTDLRVLHIGHNDWSVADSRALALAVDQALRPGVLSGTSACNIEKIQLTEALLPMKELHAGSLEELRLPRASIEDTLMLQPAVTGNLSLRKLMVAGVSLPALALFQDQLTSLDLRRQELQPQHAVLMGGVLARTTALQTLHLDDNQLAGRDAVESERTEGIFAIGEALKVNKSVTLLTLSGNLIGPMGATVLAMALAQNTVLTTLDLMDNQLCAMNVHGYGTFDGAGIQALAAALAPPTSSGGSTNTSLRNLNLASNSLMETGSTILAAALSPSSDGECHPALTKPQSGCRIGPRARESWQSVITWPSKAGKFNTVLKMLSLVDNNIGEYGKSNEGGEALNSAAHKCPARLTLGSGLRRAATDRSFTAVCQGHTLGSMQIGSQWRRRSADADGRRSVDKLPPLSHATWAALLPAGPSPARGNAPASGCQGMCRGGGAGHLETIMGLWPQLQHLHLDSGNLHAEDMTMLARELPSLHDLETLLLGHNAVDDLRGAMVVNGLLTLQYLTVLSLQSTGLAGRQSSTQSEELPAFSAVRALLTTSATLRELNLSGNLIGCDGAQEIAHGLKQSKSLLHLDLSENAIGALGTEHLAEALIPERHGTFCRSLRSLNLRGNQIQYLRPLERQARMEQGTPAAGTPAGNRRTKFQKNVVRGHHHVLKLLMTAAVPLPDRALHLNLQVLILARTPFKHGHGLATAFAPRLGFAITVTSADPID
ncbi:hypothetical protein CYMTET_33457, partial [Cymbomonas tetramitiformis]